MQPYNTTAQVTTKMKFFFIVFNCVIDLHRMRMQLLIMLKM